MAHPQLQSDHLISNQLHQLHQPHRIHRQLQEHLQHQTHHHQLQQHQIRLPPPSQLDVRNHRGEKQEQPTHPDHHHVLVVSHYTNYFYSLCSFISIILTSPHAPTHPRKCQRPPQDGRKSVQILR
ncbi:unnamed protein product [Schistosoma rodhaini]|nr:unnamed protein product [Schistosoma rodhaini]